MTTNVLHSEEFLEEARIYANVNQRSVSKQIEHWAIIGRMAEENPDLSYAFMRDVIIATAEVDAGKTSKYVRGKQD